MWQTCLGKCYGSLPLCIDVQLRQKRPCIEYWILPALAPRQNIRDTSISHVVELTCKRTLARSTGAVTTVVGTAERKPAKASSPVESVESTRFGVKPRISCLEASYAWGELEIASQTEMGEKAPKTRGRIWASHPTKAVPLHDISQWGRPLPMSSLGHPGLLYTSQVTLFGASSWSSQTDDLVGVRACAHARIIYIS